MGWCIVRLLLTSDWQAESSNLDLCEIVFQRLMASAARHKPDAIIHAGDLKEAYNPVGVEVVKFWVRKTQEIVSAGYRFIVLKGNHDRISSLHGSKDWLSVLRAAGAETVSWPVIKAVGGGCISFLPYTQDKTQEIEWAKYLVEGTSKMACEKKVLCFHTEVRGAIMNAAGTRANGNTCEQLFFDSYTACFGGHLHGFQQIQSNAWYIGSPVCHSWGEANQSKGYLLVRL
jgi:DNA repair exonuclease SbcCD nuclease subunit